MDGEVVEEPQEDVGCLVWAGLFMMAIFGSCANMPYYQEHFEKEKRLPERIEHREKVSTNQIQSVVYIGKTLSR